ncbi:MAG: VWA domain-containing protein [Bacteroidetes bacterium]|nr:VWA domain-containing protein [Bacteroidota bacterium]
MIKFAHPEYFSYFLILPLLVGALWFAWFLRKNSIRSFGELSSVLALVDRRSRVKYWLRGGLVILAFALLITAYANPLVGSKFEEVTRTGIDLIVAVDVSASMRAEDIQPSRISAARKEVQNLINNLKGDRIGIIVFAGDAYTQLPLTSDYSAAMMLSDVIDVGMAPTPGTAIASAVDLARSSFEKEEGKYKAMVIITDGENHEDDPVSSAASAAQEGIVIHTIGMGSLEGAPVPESSARGQNTYKKQADGSLVMSSLDSETLKDIAEVTNGTFTQALSGRDNLATVFENIERMEKKEYGTKQFTDYEARFQYLIIMALILLISEIFLSETRNRFLSRFSIFAVNDERRRD